MNKKVIEYIVTLGACSILTFLIAVLFGLFQYQEAFRKYAALCDGFFISGVFCTSVGLLIFVHNNGFFDIIVYGMYRFISLFRRKRKEKYETYYDYHVAMAEKEKPQYDFLVVVGVGFILISLAFLYFWAKETGEI